MQSPSKKIIEICGLPGAGKTTLARHLADTAGFSRVHLTTKAKIIRNFCFGFLRHPILFSRGLWFALRYAKSMSNFWSHYVYRYARFVKAERATSNICVLDEGPLQSVYSYSVSKVSVRKLSDLLFIVPKAQLTILLVADEVSQQEHLKKRVTRRSDNPNQILRESSQNLMTAEEVVQTAAKDNGTMFIARSVKEAQAIIEKFFNDSED